MATYSDSEIDKLISCPKTITVAPARNMKLVGADFRNNAEMAASDETKGSFSMFMRRLEDFPEDFSIGLIYKPNDGRAEITLLRMNGKHGEFNAKGDLNHPHWKFHIHKATERAQDEGRLPEKYAEETTEFASYEEALRHYVRVVNLIPKDAAKHFPDDAQTDFGFVM